MEEQLLEELRGQLEDEGPSPEHRVELLNTSLKKILNTAALHADGGVLTRVKSRLCLSGLLSQCVLVLSGDPRRLRGNWSAAGTLAQLISSCCVGVEPGERADTFNKLFLPSVMDGLLSLAGQLLQEAECVSLLRRVMEAVGWLLQAHTHLTSHVLSSVHYEQIQMCDSADVSLLCIQLWMHSCTSRSDFLSGLSDDSVLLLLNEAVSQLAVSCDSVVGGASLKLILLMASQLELQPLLLRFRGLDSLLDKDWRGRGFDRDVDQLIALIRSNKDPASQLQTCTERVRAACVIQAAWRSYRARRRVKNLNRAVGALQRRYRARRRQQQQRKEAEQMEEELKYQVCVRRQQARRKFHQRQRQLLQLLPPEQVQSYLQECERRAAVLIQSVWRGFRERRRFNDTQRHTLRRTHAQQHAARTLQRAVRRFLQKRRTAKAPPLASFWIGQKGLTDSRRVELKREVDEHVARHPSSMASRQDCEHLHQQVQLLLVSQLQGGEQQRREEQRTAALLAHTHTQLDLLKDAPPLSVVTVTDVESFLSPSGPIAARARDAHNARLQASRLPWWRKLGERDAVGTSGPAHLEGLEAEFGGLYVGGGSAM